MKNCKYCGDFFSGVSYKKYCSELCRRRQRAKIEAPHSNLTIPRDRKCLNCETIISKLDKKDKIYCSSNCKHEAHAIAKKQVSYQKVITELGNLILLNLKESSETIKVNNVLLDKNIYDSLNNLNLKINVSPKGYPYFYYKKKDIRLHRIVAYIKYKEVSTDKNPVDHINQNKLDNRSSNLRIATNSGNGANKKLKLPKSGYRGVYKNYNGWVAQITIANKVKHLGRFTDLIDAAKAYDKAALTHYGEFASLNFPIQ
jgi:hypothetical protein